MVGCLLDSNEVLGGQEEYTTENEERLFDVPIRMLADINQQVSPFFIPVSIPLPVNQLTSIDIRYRDERDGRIIVERERAGLTRYGYLYKQF